ncbi:MAG: molybdopterin-dependent oxidoreductase [Clostridiales bacterium]|nr:molybdopterin-dependent oxidoreductase [Clostridiales bacterium]
MADNRFPYDEPVNGVVCKTTPVFDAALKVTGQMKYVDDFYLPNMLYAKFLGSPYPHANIISIDTSEAEALPGVAAVVTYKDAPDVVYNGNGEDRNEFPSERVFDRRLRFIGDKVAAVAAETAEIAEEALKLIKVEYEQLPFYLDPEEAMAEGAFKIHENGNIPMEVNLGIGDVDEAFKEAYKIYERTYKLPAVYHAQLEPHGCVAEYGYDGKLTITTPTQDAFGMRENLHRIFGIPMNKLRVVNPGIGGAFGSKIDLIVEPMAAMLAMKTYRPVKMIFSRREDMVSGRTRHGMKVTNKIGIDKEGHVIALDVKAISNAGAHTTCTMSVMWAMGGKIFRNLKCQNIRFKGIPVYTNTLPAAAMRGFGSPQAFFGEQVMFNLIAKDLGMTLPEFQLLNLVDPYSVDACSGDCNGNVRVKDCLRKAMELMDYDAAIKEQEESKKSGSRYRIGVGIGVGNHGSSLYGIMPDTTAASIKVNEDATCTLMTGVSDMGNGAVTTSMMVVAETLGIKLENITPVYADTETTMYDVGLYASRGTYLGASAALKAAKKVRDILSEQAGLLLEIPGSAFTFGNERVVSVDDPTKSASIQEVVDYSRNKSYKEVAASETFSSIDGPMCYGVHMVKVEVDMETGRVRPLKYVSVHDVGKAINPGNLEGQQHGGMQMGLGYALTEEVRHNEKGQVMDTNLNKYHIFKATEMPELITSTVEEIESSGPFGAKSIGENAVVPSAPAVANAVVNAIDKEIDQIPLTPERILKYINA